MLPCVYTSPRLSNPTFISSHLNSNFCSRSLPNIQVHQITMSSFGGHRTVKRWTCSDCHEAGISIILGDCPNCEHIRCMDCDVKSHTATDAEIEEENMKIVNASTRHSSQNQPSMSRPRAEASSSRSVITGTSESSERSTILGENHAALNERVHPTRTPGLSGFQSAPLATTGPLWDQFAENERRFGLESAFLPPVAPNPFRPEPSYAAEPSR